MDFFSGENCIVAAYLRLSKEDGDLSSNEKQESNSISNQRTLILDYLKRNFPKAKLYDIYIDDGYTGTNFNRPDFERMKTDIYNDKVNMVIVKDLSRFGRDYVEAGRYIKKVFPALKIRFISIGEDFDSMNATDSDYNLILPIRNFVNDQFSGDTSYKVRSNQKAMRSAGKYIGPFVGYGRRKAPYDKHVILIDDYAAGIIKDMIADLLAGYTVNKISERLNSRGVPAPADYKRQQGINFQTSFQTGLQSKWTSKAVIRILTDPMNIGTMVQGKRHRINYKVRKTIDKPVEEQDIKESVVPALITRDLFDNIQRLLLADMRVSPGQDRVYLFSGFLYCGDCKKSMSRRKLPNGVHYICSGYNKGEACTRHSISESDLQAIIKKVIQTHIDTLINMKETLEFIDTLELEAEEVVRFDEEVENKYRELERFTKLEASLHKDRLDGIITSQEYDEFKDIYSERCKKIEEAIKNIKKEVENITLRDKENRAWLQRFAEYKKIEKLDRLILVTLIDRIFIYENKEMEIIFRYQDEYERLLQAIRLIENYCTSRSKALPYRREVE